MKTKFEYQCIDCQSVYPGEGIIYLCPSCSEKNQPGMPPFGVLKIIFDYQVIKDQIENDVDLYSKLYYDDFLPLLPIRSHESWPKLKIGGTPCYRYEPVDFECFLKDDSQNPTFSFKDRASALVSAFAKENGISMLVAASTGNAGSSLAGICASQGQNTVIVVPAKAPAAKLTQALMYGATLIPVKGTYDDAFDLSIRLSEKYQWYNRNTAYNPLTIEGKKVVSYELFADVGYRVPDRIFIPTGDGVILSGVYKGFEDLMQLGIVDNMPVMVAVQAKGSPNLYKNLNSRSFTFRKSKTIADSISVDVPRNFRMSKFYMKKYKGETICVSDDEILEASMKLAATTGVFAEPAAAAAFAGMLKYKAQGLITGYSLNVVLLTGSGLKDTGAMKEVIRMPEAVNPDIKEVKKILAGL